MPAGLALNPPSPMYVTDNARTVNVPTVVHAKAVNLRQGKCKNGGCPPVFMRK